MKPRTPELLAVLLTCLIAVLLLPGKTVWAADPPIPLAEDTPPPLGSNTPPLVPTATATPVAPVPAKRGGKRNQATDGTPKPTRVRGPKEIKFPLSPGDTGHDFTMPQLGNAGELLSKLMSTKITRLDNERVEMHGTLIDLNHPDGKSDFHVELPDSIFNLKTNIITSDHPVTVRTADFELTGERMEFNTVDRTGELQGHVHMVIHNFKQVAGVIPATPAP